nr:unnamed protein product [Spirometra erinaceieuropaei]
MPFNISKCNFLQLGSFRASSPRTYFLEGTPLQLVDSQKDLGVWITSSLKPTLHCAKAAKSAMATLQIIKRAFMGFDPDSFSKIFGTYVRPHLEYAIQAWRPWTAKDYTVLEKVQRRATKVTQGLGALSYESRLSTLNLFPLSYRTDLLEEEQRKQDQLPIKPAVQVSSRLSNMHSLLLADDCSVNTVSEADIQRTIAGGLPTLDSYKNKVIHDANSQPISSCLRREKMPGAPVDLVRHLWTQSINPIDPTDVALSPLCSNTHDVHYNDPLTAHGQHPRAAPPSDAALSIIPATTPAAKNTARSPPLHNRK